MNRGLNRHLVGFLGGLLKQLPWQGAAAFYREALYRGTVYRDGSRQHSLRRDQFLPGEVPAFGAGLSANHQAGVIFHDRKGAAARAP
jgi:hypothetical protein